MPDFTFTPSSDNLCYNPTGQCWTAVSGPYKKGELPSGSYTVKRNKITGYTSSINKSFKDGTGKGFFLPIEPDFGTTRSGFGIHPDGYVPGTAGCIGLKAHDTSDFYRLIASLPYSDLSLEVK